MIETGDICVCSICNHRWLASVGEDGAIVVPKRCSRCKSSRWNVGVSKTVAASSPRGKRMHAKKLLRRGSGRVGRPSAPATPGDDSPSSAPRKRAGKFHCRLCTKPTIEWGPGFRRCESCRVNQEA